MPRKAVDEPTAENQLYARYRYECKRRNIFWGLTKVEFHALTSAPCQYCGQPPMQIIKHDKRRYTYNGIDRVDSRMGYVISNCCAACRRCNQAKSDSSLQDFLAWINRLVSFHGTRTLPSEPQLQSESKEGAPGNEGAQETTQERGDTTPKRGGGPPHDC